MSIQNEFQSVWHELKAKTRLLPILDFVR